MHRSVRYLWPVRNCHETDVRMLDTISLRSFKLKEGSWLIRQFPVTAFSFIREEKSPESIMNSEDCEGTGHKHKEVPRQASVNQTGLICLTTEALGTWLQP